ncbi:MAG: EAL domain-containing protein [Clostridia bacterium]|nr:EAL domain-containing protein [Clostridia bacterium]
MKKSPRIFEKISSLMSSFMAFYPFGLSKDEPGINISEAMATRFGLRAGNISEAELSDAVTVATGGVNGSTMRHADGILYRRPDGKYMMVSYSPIHGKERGYIHEVHGSSSATKCPPISELPSFGKLSAALERRADGLFCVMRVVPYSEKGEVFDYRCIAEFFDNLRRILTSPAIFWLGEKNYAVLISPDELDVLRKVIGRPLEIGGEIIRFAVAFAYISPSDSGLAAEKLAFCLKRLGAGAVGGVYKFNADDYRNYCFVKERRTELSKRLSEWAFKFEFRPVVSVKTGRAECFWVRTVSGEGFVLDCYYNGLLVELDRALLGKLISKLERGKLPVVSYCVPLYSSEDNLDLVSELAELLAEKGKTLYVELEERVSRYDAATAARVGRFRDLDAKVCLSDREIKPWELPDIHRMSFDGVRVFDQTDAEIKACADFCRTYRMDCAVFGVHTEDKFIALRRLGVDFCRGDLFGAPTKSPEGEIFPLPTVEYEPEEEPEEIEADASGEQKEFNPNKYIAKAIYSKLKGVINGDPNLKPRDPMEKMEGMESTDPTEKLEPEEGGELEFTEREEGLGAKKKRKEITDPKKQEKRQKKEVKKGKLKKIKLEKKK